MNKSKAKNDEVAIRRMKRWAWIFSAIVFILIGMARKPIITLPEGWSFSFLPPLYSSFNAITACLLLLALYFIKKKDVVRHRKTIYIAIIFSVLFLLLYVVYHFTTPETKFGDANHDGVVDAEELLAVGKWRVAYLLILLSHIALAAFVLPLVLFTFIRAYTEQFDKHKKMARWVFPIWLYVAITGPVIYLMLRPFYG